MKTKFYLFFFLVIGSLPVSLAQASVTGASYAPALLPFSIVLGANGWSICEENAGNSAVSAFSLSADDHFSNIHGVIEPTSGVLKSGHPICIEAPEATAARPVITVREAATTAPQEVHSYIVELRNYLGKTQEFVIKGYDVLSVEIEGQTTITAQEGRLIIDMLENNVKKIMFKGNALTSESLESKLAKVCLKYNYQYNQMARHYYCYETNDGSRIHCTPVPVNARTQKKPCELVLRNEEFFKNRLGDLRVCDSILTTGFFVYSSFSYLHKYGKHINYGRKLVTRYKIYDFDNQAIAFCNDLLLTSSGIGIPLTTDVIRVDSVEVLNRRGKVIGKKAVSRTEQVTKYSYIPFADFVGYSFESHENSERAIVVRNKSNQKSVYGNDLYTDKQGFSNTEIIQFFNDVKKAINENTR